MPSITASRLATHLLGTEPSILIKKVTQSSLKTTLRLGRVKLLLLMEWFRKEALIKVNVMVLAEPGLPMVKSKRETLSTTKSTENSRSNM